MEDTFCHAYFSSSSFFFGSTTIDSTVAPLLVQVQLVQVALFLEEDNTLA